MTTLNIFSWTAERWEFVLGTSAVVFVALSVIASFGALYASKLVKKHDAERVIKLETDLSDAKRKQAEAEAVVATLGYQTSPRWAKFTAQSLGCEGILKELPPRRIEIIYTEGSVEGFRLAWNVGLWLKRYKWDIAPLKTVPSTLDLLPELARLNWSDAVMLTRDGNQEDMQNPPKTPEIALSRCTGFFTYWDKDETVPEGVIRLIITVP